MLNKDQLAFVRAPIADIKLLGNPGCGKTCSIIHYILHHNLSSKEFLVFTFSKAAQEDFLTKGKLLSSEFNSMNIRTLHSVSYEIYKHITGSANKFLQTLILSTKICLSKNPEKIIELYKGVKVIIVDEAQDISQTQYDLVIAIANIIKCKVIMVGDPNQNIYQFQNGSDRFLLDHPGLEFRLRTNYRSGKSIIDFLNQIKPHTDSEMVCGNLQKCEKPILFNGSVQEMQKFIVDKINELRKTIDLSEIAIIGSMKKSGFNYKAIGLSFAAHVLHDAGIPFIQHYQDGKISTSVRASPELGKVNLMTCHGSKGLEFHTTIVINYHFNTFSRVPTKNAHREHCYLWYVGLSRAKTNLIIIKDVSKKINPQIRKVNSLHYEVKGSSFKIDKEIKFSQETQQLMFHVTDAISDFDEKTLLEIQESNFFSEVTVDIPESFTITEDLDLNRSALYGNIMESVFQYIYFKKQGNVEKFIHNFLLRINRQIVLHRNYNYAIDGLKKKGVLDSSNNTNYKFCKLFRNESNKGVIDEIMKNIIRIAEENQVDVEDIAVRVTVNNNAQEYDRNYLIEKCNQLRDPGSDSFDIIFDMVRYLYNYEHEKRFANVLDYSTDKENLFTYYQNVEDCVEFLDAKLNFEVGLYHPLINLSGRADATAAGEIIELKFTNHLTELHKIQCMLYMACSGISTARLINMKTMKMITMKINKNNKWKMHELIAKALGSSMAKKVIITDVSPNEHYIYELRTNSIVSAGDIANFKKVMSSLGNCRKINYLNTPLCQKNYKQNKPMENVCMIVKLLRSLQRTDI